MSMSSSNALAYYLSRCVAVDDAKPSFFLFVPPFPPLRGDARCTIHCLPALGKIPQLQCKVCLCLYHHECAKKSHADTESGTFTCEVMRDRVAQSDTFRTLISVLTFFVELQFQIYKVNAKCMVKKASSVATDSGCDTQFREKSSSACDA